MAETTTLPAMPQSLRGLKDLPIVRQLALLVGIAAAVAGGIAMFTWSQQPGYVGLYADLSGKDAADAADALRAANIPYKLDPSGALMVPGAQVHEARLQLASQGLPKGGAQGFEMMQQDPGFGVSTFLEGARYNHALETELARSIGLLSPVKAARVHLAIPKATAFARPGEGPSASVLVELHAGQSLEANQVQAIVHMVGSSVPDLDASRVTVVDQFGRLLSRNDSDSSLALTTEQFDHARRVEADFARRIEQLLAPVTGPGKVSTQVSADLDFSVTEEARESYAPDKSVVKSEQTSQETSRGGAGNGAGGAAQGVPGALSNQPPEAQPAIPLNAVAGSSPEGPINQSTNSTKNYEVDRTLSHTREVGGRLKKLTVAVLVDDLPRADKDGAVKLQPLSADELKKIELLVKDAIGFDETRGDRVSVQNVSFLPPTTVDAEVTPIWQQPQAQTLARQAFGALAVIVLIFAVVRPTLKSLFAAPRPAAALSQPADGTLIPAGGGAAAIAGGGTYTDEPERLVALPPYEQKLALAKTAVAQDPKKVAQVVKAWLGEEGSA